MSVLSELRDHIRHERQIAAQRRELAVMHDEIAEERDQNERMRTGMHRCLACDYRREALAMRAEEKSSPGSATQ